MIGNIYERWRKNILKEFTAFYKNRGVWIFGGVVDSQLNTGDYDYINVGIYFTTPKSVRYRLEKEIPDLPDMGSDAFWADLI